MSLPMEQQMPVYRQITIHLDEARALRLLLEQGSNWKTWRHIPESVFAQFVEWGFLDGGRGVISLDRLAGTKLLINVGRTCKHPHERQKQFESTLGSQSLRGIKDLLADRLDGLSTTIRVNHSYRLHPKEATGLLMIYREGLVHTGRKGGVPAVVRTALLRPSFILKVDGDRPGVCFNRGAVSKMQLVPHAGTEPRRIARTGEIEPVELPLDHWFDELVAIAAPS